MKSRSTTHPVLIAMSTSLLVEARVDFRMQWLCSQALIWPVLLFALTHPAFLDMEVIVERPMGPGLHRMHQEVGLYSLPWFLWCLVFPSYKSSTPPWSGKPKLSALSQFCCQCSLWCSWKALYFFFYLYIPGSFFQPKEGSPDSVENIGTISSRKFWDGPSWVPLLSSKAWTSSTST